METTTTTPGVQMCHKLTRITCGWLHKNESSSSEWVSTTMLSSGVYVTEFKYIQVMSESVASALQLVDSDVTQQIRLSR